MNILNQVSVENNTYVISAAQIVISEGYLEMVIGLGTHLHCFFKILSTNRKDHNFLKIRKIYSYSRTTVKHVDIHEQLAILICFCLGKR